MDCGEEDRVNWGGDPKEGMEDDGWSDWVKPSSFLFVPPRIDGQMTRAVHAADSDRGDEGVACAGNPILIDQQDWIGRLQL